MNEHNAYIVKARSQKSDSFLACLTQRPGLGPLSTEDEDEMAPNSFVELELWWALKQD